MNTESKLIPILFGIAATVVLFTGLYCVGVMLQTPTKVVSKSNSIGLVNAPAVTEGDTAAAYQVVKYNCEQSGGVFGNKQCNCGVGNTYDKNSGLCATPMGTAGGNSGDVEKQGQELLMLKNTIVQYNCEASGGSFKNTACICPKENGETLKYDSETGYCMTDFGIPGGDEGETARKLASCEMMKNQ